MTDRALASWLSGHFLCVLLEIAIAQPLELGSAHRNAGQEGRVSTMNRLTRRFLKRVPGNTGLLSACLCVTDLKEAGRG